jgi:DNA-binding IclR family transcriptional regulator
VQPDDALSLRILNHLAECYLPVMSDWVDATAIAASIGLPVEEVERRCAELQAQGLVETAAPDDEHGSAAALITVKGLLAVGRLP